MGDAKGPGYRSVEWEDATPPAFLGMVPTVPITKKFWGKKHVGVQIGPVTRLRGERVPKGGHFFKVFLSSRVCHNFIVPHAFVSPGCLQMCNHVYMTPIGVNGD